MAKKFEPPKRRQPCWKPFAAILKLFYKKPIIINLNNHIDDSSVFIANHGAMNGPMEYALYLPYFHASWGASPMMGKYKERYHYLRDVYFMQKRGRKKFSASLLAGFEAIFSLAIYRGMKMLPTYTDMRFATTVKNSITCLDNNVGIMIFPEDSSDGYHTVLKSFIPGFVILAERYKKQNGKNVPMYPVYYHGKKNVIVIGKGSTLDDYPNMNRQQIADSFCQQVNDLYENYIKDKYFSKAELKEQKKKQKEELKKNK